MTTLAHGAHIGVNLGPMLRMVLKNKYNLTLFSLMSENYENTWGGGVAIKAPLC